MDIVIGNLSMRGRLSTQTSCQNLTRYHSPILKYAFFWTPPSFSLSLSKYRFHRKMPPLLEAGLQWTRNCHGYFLPIGFLSPQRRAKASCQQTSGHLDNCSYSKASLFLWRAVILCLCWIGLTFLLIFLFFANVSNTGNGNRRFDPLRFWGPLP